MIQSDTLPQQAVDYLNQIAEAKNKAAESLGRQGAQQELLNFCNQWYVSAYTWRKQSYEDDWISFQRNADGRYDPRLAAKMKDWQSKAFCDITPSHRENIHSELFRLVAGSRPIMDVLPRAGGDPEQAENIKDLSLREMEKSRFEVEYNKILEDKTTYGSGFCRMWYETRVEERPVRVPITEQLDLSSLGSIQRHMGGQPNVLGYRTQMQPKVVYRGVRIAHIPIWDFFPDPKALQIEGHTCLFRSWINLQKIMNSVAAGEFMPEAAVVMREQASDENVPPDRSQLQLERQIADSAPRREGYQKTWEYYELFGRLPQKWIYPLLKEPLEITDAEKLVPARVIWHKKAIFCVYLNDDYEGEPPFLKDDYFPVNGRFYGRGIPEMLRNPQMVINAVVNQRLDEGNLALQEGLAVKEKGIVNPQDIIEGGPGLVVRIAEKATGPNGDVRNAIFPLGRPDVKLNAGFTEVHEWERMASERTSANRVTLGSQGLVHDSNRTLGGQQLLKRTAGEKFAFIAMLSEFSFMYKIFRSYWKLIYANVNAEDIVAAIGPQRAQGFQLMSPEEVELSYRYEPKGIFERESKAEMQGRLEALWEQFKGAPWLNPMAFFDQEAKSFNLDPERLKVPESDAVQIQAMAQGMAEPMAKKMLSDIVLGQAAKDVERNISEKIAGDAVEDASDGKEKPDGRTA